jgi:hypothetical protein
MFRWFMSAAAIAAAIFVSSQASAVDLSPDQQSAICGARKTCKIETIADAGQGPGNVKLTVVEVRFAVADKPAEAPEDGCIGDLEATDAPERDGGLEAWLIAGGDAPKRVLALCNDGYGAAGVGEDQLAVTPNLLTWDQSGGSAWRWTATKQIRLAPLAVVKEFDCSYHDVAPGTGTYTEVDRVNLTARAVGAMAGHKFKDDDEIGCPDWPNGPDATLPTGPVWAGGYAVPLPAPNPDGTGTSYPDGIALGDCALELTTDGTKGFMVYGKPADEGAATVRVVKESESSLLIQVYDPSAAAELKSGKAKSWVGQPHLEIWTSEWANPEDNDGENGQTTIFHQFAIGLDDQTYPGTNAIKPLPKVTHWPAKDEAGHDVTTYRVTWQGDENTPSFGIGVVYSQAKDGKQARMISNAQIKKNKPLYLPDAWSNFPEDQGIPSASCAVNADKRLDVVKN